MRAATQPQRKPFDIALPAGDAERDLQVAIEVIRVGAGGLGVVAAVDEVVDERGVEARHFERRSADPPEQTRDRGAVCFEAGGEMVVFAAEDDGPVARERPRFVMEPRRIEDRSIENELVHLDISIFGAALVTALKPLWPTAP